MGVGGCGVGDGGAAVGVRGTVGGREVDVGVGCWMVGVALADGGEGDVTASGVLEIGPHASIPRLNRIKIAKMRMSLQVSFIMHPPPSTQRKSHLFA